MRVIPVVVVLVALAGCGSETKRAKTVAAPIPPPQIRGTSPLIPTLPDGPAPEGAEKVIRGWAAAVREADWGRAADLMATGARVQNGGAVERLQSRNHVLFWNATLPCGAKVEEIGGARGYAIVRFRLTQRKGADCGSGTGRVARAAIRVEDGHIVGWYRIT